MLLQKFFPACIVALVLPSLILSVPHGQDYPANNLVTRASLAKAELVHRFPLYYWVENLAVRASGEVLTTLLSPTADLYQIDPSKPAGSNVELVHTFEQATNATGIAEGAPDVFYVAAGNVSYPTGMGVAGSWAIYSADFRGCAKAQDATVEKVADIPKGLLLNGIDFLDAHKGTLLIADSQGEAIYSLNVHTKAFEVAINETQTQDTGLAINGIKVHHELHAKSSVYFSNSGKAALFKQRVNEDGTAAGSATVVYKSAPKAFNPDDFALDAQKNAYIANAATDNVVLHRAGSGTISNVTSVVGCTSAALGRSRKDVRERVLYISSSGGDDQYRVGDVTNPGGLYKVHV
ncbi:MAG: hypothetical protein M1828_006683 [Chrysothrix sp. TS-e1954]|nr:MAG: hypothetical protein M1828_006683 [Chrysothrix sp. TS-e1954]